LLNRGARLTELLKQGQYQPMPVELQASVIYAGVNGYLDRIKTTDVVRYERGLVSELEAKGEEILKAIREEGAISEATEEKLKSLIETYTKNFA
jgi:F-type H+-transporting ATPase subunit alpha